VQINWVFLALARAAGFQAYAVMVAARNDDFFNPKYMRASDLNANAALVILNGKEVYLDPGTVFTSFGFLPWGETGVKGLKLDKDGGAWVTIPAPNSSATQIVRKADLKIDSDGSIQGKLSITYSGFEAAWRRFVERYEDEVHRKKFLEDDVRKSIPTGVEIELVNKPDWASSAPTFAADFTLKVPGWISGAGRRELLPVGLFSAAEKHTCENAVRVHPLYFAYKLQKIDDIRIELPADWQVNSLPQPLSKDAGLVSYSFQVESDNGTLYLQRVLRLDLISAGQEQYQVISNFYQAVRSGDEQQIVLQPGGTAGGN
jgi:hypothetical protein